MRCGSRRPARAEFHARLPCRWCSSPTTSAPSPRSGNTASRARLPGPSLDGFLPDRDAADEIAIEIVAEARLIAELDGAARGSRDGRGEDAPVPVAPAGRYVARKREVG